MNKHFLWLLAASIFFLSANASNATDEERFYKYLKTCRTFNSVKTNSENFKSGRIIYGPDGQNCKIRVVISPGYDMTCNLTEAERKVGLDAYYERKYDGYRSEDYTNWAPKHIFWKELLHSQACTYNYEHIGL